MVKFLNTILFEVSRENLEKITQYIKNNFEGDCITKDNFGDKYIEFYLHSHTAFSSKFVTNLVTLLESFETNK